MTSDHLAALPKDSTIIWVNYLLEDSRCRRHPHPRRPRPRRPSVFDPLKFPTCRVSKAFCLAAFFVLFAIPAALAFDPSLPPTAEDHRKVLEQGFAASLQEIESALTRAYRPEKYASLVFIGLSGREDGKSG